MDLSEDELARRRRRRPGRKEREREDSVPGLPSKPPIILAKSTSTDRPQQLSVPPVDVSASSPVKVPESTPVVMLRTRRSEDPLASPGLGAQSIPSMLASEGIVPASPSTPAYQIQRNPHTGHGGPAASTGEGGSLQSRLAPPLEMTHSMKLVDDTMQWCDNGMEVLLDQTDFFVIGILGLQGTGKSTILSMLAGNKPTQLPKSYVFRSQSREAREAGGHQTNGIDMYVTAERIILLDTQPMLSPSVLDFMIHNDKKYPAEYSCVENCIEMQSLQIATFLLTVCNAVIISMDWFVDRNFIKFLQTAEMLKPPKPSGGHDGTTPSDDNPEYYPHVVFLHNKATRDNFHCDNYNLMQTTLGSLLKHTKLKMKGNLHMADGRLIPSLNKKTAPSGVNLYLLPEMENSLHNGQTREGISSLLSSYQGHPSFETLSKHLYHEIVTLPRSPLTHTTLSEKNWFHYAARTWEAVKKSQLLAEYNRLLP